MSSDADLVVVGRVRKAHGLDGVVVVEPMTADPGLVYSPGRELLAGTVRAEPVLPARTLHIEMAEPFQGGFRVRFREISGRVEADLWRQRYLFAPRAELPEPSPDEIYLHDLVGLAVELETGESVGSVEAYYELPHDVMIEVRRAADSVMIPYRFVSRVDLIGKRIVVDPPDGLL